MYFAHISYIIVVNSLVSKKKLKKVLGENNITHAFWGAELF